MAANIDLSNILNKYEKQLAAGPKAAERENMLEILLRWSHDPDLNHESRSRALALLRKHAPHLRI
jgi:hypothetical protein